MSLHVLRDSGITVTDQFCGAGGSTIGAKRAGVIVVEAQNHWKRAIETYSANHQNTRVHHADVSNTDPRKLASTDGLLTSPECTTYSPAGGNVPRVLSQRDMFMPDVDDPKFQRSRATMQDVIRYAEYHRYEFIVVENVVEVTRWELFHWWLQGMRLLGYEFRIVCFNSMFGWPTPQSRDRIYIVFWKRGNRAPNLDIHPIARCHACEATVESVQTWKRAALARAADTFGQPIGKYRRQYVYSCPRCTRTVEPYYYAAMNAIDFSVPGERIGDRARDLKPRTRARIAYGLRKFAHRPLLIRTLDGQRFDCRVRDAQGAPLDTQTGTNQTGVAAPFVVKIKGADPSHISSSSTRVDEHLPTLVANSKTAALVTPAAVAMLIDARNGSRLGCRVRDAATDPIGTQTAGRDYGIAMHPLLVETRHGSDGDTARVTDPTADPLAPRTTKNGEAIVLGPGFITTAGSNETGPRHLGVDAMPTVTTVERLALLLGPAFVGAHRTNNDPSALSDALRTITTGRGGGGQFLVSGSALISLRDSDAMYVGALDSELRTQATTPQQGIIGIERAPIVIDYANDARTLADALPTQPTHAQRGVAEPGESIDVDDCYFRMLLDYEIGRGMAFPDDYIVTGNSTERVKQFGNAVTPPVMDILTRRCAASLAPELEP